MADNISLNDNTTSGAILATDDVTGVHYQLIKLGYGALDSFTIVDGTNGLPVQLTGDNIASLSSSYTVAAIKAAVTVADGSVVSLSSSYTVAAIKAAVTVADGSVASLSSSYTVIVKSGTITTVTNPVTVTGAVAVSLSHSVVVSNTVAVTTDNISLSGGGTIAAVTNITNPVTVTGAVAVSLSHSVVVSNTVSVTTDNISLSGSISVFISGGSASGTEYTEDDAAPANPDGGATMLVRDDTPGTLVSLDGDWVAQRGTNYGAGFVQVVDSSGNFIDTFGGSGGTASADDADFTAGVTQGTPAMGVYESTPSSVTDGDMGMVGISQTRRLLVDANLGSLSNSISVFISGGSSSGTEYTDDVGSLSVGAAGGAILAAATPTNGTVDANDLGVVAMSLDRRLHVDAQIVGQDANVTITDGPIVSLSSSYTVASIKAALPAGDNNIGNVDIVTIPDVSLTGSISVFVSNTVAVTTDNISLSGGGTIAAVTSITNPVTVTGAVAVSLSHSVVVSNTVAVTTDNISLSGGGTIAAVTAITNPVTVTGAVAVSLSHSVVISSMPAVTGAVSLTGSSSVLVGGTVAHDAAATGTNPVLNGWEARTTMPTAVGDGDVVRAMADDNGRVVNTPVAPRDLVGMLTHTLTVSTTTTWLPAGGAGVYRDIIGFTLTNPSSASQATVIIYTSVTTGTVVFHAELAPSGGLVYTPSTPIPATVANNAWGIQCNVTNLRSSIQYVNNN